MQMVVRAEKFAAPGATNTLEAAARACVQLLAGVDAGDDADAQDAVARWRRGRIRKVVRRARGNAWLAADLPGAVCVQVGDAEVRAYLPVPVDQVPAQVKKLQVSGLDLADEGHEPGAVFPESRVVILVNPDVPMSTGKLAAQVAHAAQLIYESTPASMDESKKGQWIADGAPVTVATPSRSGWESSLTSPVRIIDAGFTEIPPGTVTCTAQHRLYVHN